LLKALRGIGAELFIASGTDDHDVKAEAHALGVAGYFSKISGAPAGVEDCSKESVIRGLLSMGIPGSRLAVVGDGKVEIAVGRENGARTLGVASDEKLRRGIDPAKQSRLIKAGADKITGDFLDLEGLMRFFKGEG
jgi:phosphoglycolate phosphatase-like HAD superfamily hydrolase